jgi:hypothetical protein
MMTAHCGVCLLINDIMNDYVWQRTCGVSRLNSGRKTRLICGSVEWKLMDDPEGPEA